MKLFRKPPEESGLALYSSQYSPQLAVADPPVPRYRRLELATPLPAPPPPEETALSRVTRRRGIALSFLVTLGALGGFGGSVWYALEFAPRYAGGDIGQFFRVEPQPPAEAMAVPVPAESGHTGRSASVQFERLVLPPREPRH